MCVYCGACVCVSVCHVFTVQVVVRGGEVLLVGDCDHSAILHTTVLYNI